jgi:hypothetical protein
MSWAKVGDGGCMTRSSAILINSLPKNTDLRRGPGACHFYGSLWRPPASQIVICDVWRGEFVMRARFQF